MEHNTKPKAMSKKELALKYGIDVGTLRKWLITIPDLGLTPDQKILTPIQVSKIYQFIGEP